MLLSSYVLPAVHEVLEPVPRLLQPLRLRHAVHQDFHCLGQLLGQLQICLGLRALLGSILVLTVLVDGCGALPIDDFTQILHRDGHEGDIRDGSQHQLLPVLVNLPEKLLYPGFLFLYPLDSV